MATRGIIAVQRSSGWRGRYVHWDNDPERMVEVLTNLVKRDGIMQVALTLIDNTASWSIIDDACTCPADAFDKQNIVEGYGVTHSDIDPNSDAAWYTEETEDYSWAEYIYIIRQAGIEVLTVRRQEDGTETTLPYGIHFWADLIPNYYNN